MMELSLHRIQRMFEKCHEVAKDSHDINTQVGAILVHKDSRAKVCEGFNGYVRGAQDDCLPEDAPEKYRYMVHAEVNVICNAFRTGAIKYKPQDYVMFCTISPCENCARVLLQCGITEVYFEKLHVSFQNYREGTNSPTPAEDIVGVVTTYIDWAGTYQPRTEILGHWKKEDVLFYKVNIRPK